MSDDEFMREVLDDAVSDVEPTDRLTAIRSRTRTAQRSRRTWYAVGTAGLAAAAVVVAVAVVGSGDDTEDRPDVAAPPTSDSTPTSPETDSPVVEPPDETTPVYYVGDGGNGPDAADEALYRYFEPAGDPLELLMTTPSDPDYRTLWEPGSLSSYEVTADAIVVQGDARGIDDTLAAQQLVYTMQAVTNTTLPVKLENPAQKIPTFRRADPLEVLSHVNISDPGERYGYSGSFTARGVGNGFEGTIVCRLMDEAGGEVWSEPTIAGAGDALEEWEVEVDLTGLPEGGYVLVCQNDDPTGGAQGLGTFTDNRTIYVTEPPSEVTTAPVPGPGEPGPGSRVFYVGDGPAGAEAPDQVLYAVDLLGYGTPLSFLMSTPDDPDYRTLWPAGSLESFEVDEGVIRVQVNGGPIDDEMARQQLIYTLQAATRSTLPVQLELDADRGAQNNPRYTAAPALSVLSLMNVLQPGGAGATYENDTSITVIGLAHSFEGYAGCDLLDADGAGVRQAATTTGALRDDRLSPWQLRIRLQGLTPGDYTLSCYTDDPIGGGEGRGRDVDTRSITVTRA